MRKAWKQTYSKTYSSITKETVGVAWKEAEHWSVWHGDLEYCKLEGTFKVRNYFILKSKKMRKGRIELLEIQEEKNSQTARSFLEYA